MMYKLVAKQKNNDSRTHLSTMALNRGRCDMHRAVMVCGVGSREARVRV